MCGAGLSEQKVMGRRLNSSQGYRPKNKIGITTTIMKCKSCNLIYSNPLPIPNNIQDHYGVLPETYWNEDYFIVDPNYSKDLIDQLKAHLDFGKNLKSIDIGAGIGKGMIALKNAGFDAFGIEPSEQFYERAIHKMGVQKDKIQCLMIENAVFENDQFDFVNFSAVLEHLYDPSGAIEIAMKWLKPGGIIKIAVPSSSWLVGKLINASYRLRGYDFVGNVSPMHSPFHLYEFSLKSFQENAKRNNFSILDAKYEVCQTMLPKKFDFILKPIMSRTKTGMEIYVLLQKNK